MKNILGRTVEFDVKGDSETNADRCSRRGNREQQASPRTGTFRLALQDMNFGEHAPLFGIHRDALMLGSVGQVLFTTRAHEMPLARAGSPGPREGAGCQTAQCTCDRHQGSAGFRPQTLLHLFHLDSSCLTCGRCYH